VGIDFAASGFYKEGKYVYWNRVMSRDQHMKYTINLVKKYNLVYLEDPLEENDFAGFAALRKSLKKVVVTGDDLTTTNPSRLKTAIEKKAIGGIIVKPIR